MSSPPIGLLPVGQGGSGTSLADAIVNLRNGAIAYCQSRNDNDQAIFDVACNNYNLNAGSGQHHDPPLVKPVPPAKWVLSPPDQNGFIFPMQSATETIPINVPLQDVDQGTLTVMTPIKNKISINWGTQNGAWVDAWKDDGFPLGMVTPPIQAPDGSMHTYEKFGGIGGAWYLQVS